MINFKEAVGADYFSEADFLRSETANINRFKNTYDKPEHRDNIINLAKRWLVPLQERYRSQYGGKIMITSGYRSNRLNALILGASTNSDHTRGQAVDISTKFTVLLKNFIQAETVNGSLSPYSKMIYYPDKNFIHVSYVPGFAGVPIYSMDSGKTFKNLEIN